MKKILYLTLFLGLTTVSFAQKTMKYKTVSSFFIERIEGKKGFSKLKKVEAEILVDSNKKVITINTEKKQIFLITEFKPTESGNNFTMTSYKCLDEKKVECNLSIIKFSKPNENGVLQQLFISYQNIDYVFDMNLIKD